jgi:hypothetical protein
MNPDPILSDHKYICTWPSGNTRTVTVRYINDGPNPDAANVCWPEGTPGVTFTAMVPLTWLKPLEG